MTDYLDTQVLQWLIEGNTRPLTRNAERLIETADLLISPMVTRELDLLYEIGRTKLQWRDVQTEVEYAIGLRVSDLPFVRVVDAARHESWTRDLFDRTIVAQAKADGLAYLVSADGQIRTQYQRAVW